MRDQKLLRDPVRIRGVIVQVDTMARVRLDVGIKCPRGREGRGDGAGDRRRVAGRRAIATAEDEVLVCDGALVEQTSR